MLQNLLNFSAKLSRTAHKKNLEMRVEAENGATAGKFDLAKRAKAADLDAIHDTVHEMAKDEARHRKSIRCFVFLRDTSANLQSTQNMIRLPGFAYLNSVEPFLN